MLRPLPSIGLYLHWPYCRTKCPYCAFYSQAQKNTDAQAENWFSLCLTDMEKAYAMTEGRRLTSLFFGGGTPSLIPPFFLEKIIDKAASLWGFTSSPEISLEANPADLTATGALSALKQAGLTRLSIGLQSLDDSALSFLGRRHTAAIGRNVWEKACSLFGIESLSADLIYARPDQSLKGWEKELRDLLSYQPYHLSLYTLSADSDTPLAQSVNQGTVFLPDDDLALDFFSLTRQLTKDAGLNGYEVSNYARPSHECRHNLLYWQGGDYIGIGASAHGRLSLPDGTFLATQNAANIVDWQTGRRPFSETTQLSARDRAEERVLMGLRLHEGIDLSRIARETGFDIEAYLNETQKRFFLEDGLIHEEKSCLSITEKGLPFLDKISLDLLSLE